MKHIILSAAFLAGLSGTAISQARLTLSDGAFAVISGGAKLVVDNPAPNAIQTAGSGGKIISGGETSGVKWNIGAATGTYVFPFTTTPASQGGDEVAIPLTVNITTPGSADGSLSVSTYKTNNQNQPYPAGVTNMDVITPGSDGSLYAIDRFWIINAQSYSTQPAVTLSFGYNDGPAEAGGSNAITESSLRAQRWDDGGNTWSGGQFGMANTATNMVDGVVVPSGSFRTIWTLVSSATPLPVTLLSLGAENAGDRNRIEWESAAEDNLASYTVERSADGSGFSRITEVTAQGKAWGYIVYDNQPNAGLTYYRLKMTDQDGSYRYSETVKAFYQTKGEITMEAWPNPVLDLLAIRTYGTKEGSLVLSNAAGQQVATEAVHDGRAVVKAKDLAAGIYFLRFTDAGSGAVLVRQLVKQ